MLTPSLASAQPSAPTPRVSIGGGLGFAVPFHGDFDFTPWAWETDVRVALSSRVVVEAAVGEWRHSETTGARDIAVAMPPGRIGRLEQTTTRVQRLVGANVLFRTGPRRVRPFAGGGLGLVQHARRTRQTTADCSPGVSCGSFETSFSNTSGAVLGVGGADVRLSARLAAYGQARLVVPMTDPGGSDLRVTTGLRWGFGG
jgi:hypothetical protein